MRWAVRVSLYMKLKCDVSYVSSSLQVWSHRNRRPWGLICRNLTLPRPLPMAATAPWATVSLPCRAGVCPWRWGGKWTSGWRTTMLAALFLEHFPPPLDCSLNGGIKGCGALSRVGLFPWSWLVSLQHIESLSHPQTGFFRGVSCSDGWNP